MIQLQSEIHRRTGVWTEVSFIWERLGELYNLDILDENCSPTPSIPNTPHSLSPLPRKRPITKSQIFPTPNSTSKCKSAAHPTSTRSESPLSSPSPSPSPSPSLSSSKDYLVKSTEHPLQKKRRIKGQQRQNGQIEEDRKSLSAEIINSVHFNTFQLPCLYSPLEHGGSTLGEELIDGIWVNLRGYEWEEEEMEVWRGMIYPRAEEKDMDLDWGVHLTKLVGVVPENKKKNEGRRGKGNGNGKEKEVIDDKLDNEEVGEDVKEEVDQSITSKSQPVKTSSVRRGTSVEAVNPDIDLETVKCDQDGGSRGRTNGMRGRRSVSTRNSRRASTLTQQDSVEIGQDEKKDDVAMVGSSKRGKRKRTSKR
ncbi:hypothetical protein M231_04736 [Tremella mesenterica]|uniref:Uncharacterized protein n=1 Tax=Tremella mesenterica TaxID=5217 RepID=A0A4Q1BK06_TREME|nr:hypothetical protein M231_04736 [Tremella mesenterica]